jgi:hypothetical protein
LQYTISTSLSTNAPLEGRESKLTDKFNEYPILSVLIAIVASENAFATDQDDYSVGILFCLKTRVIALTN